MHAAVKNISQKKISLDITSAALPVRVSLAPGQAVDIEDDVSVDALQRDPQVQVLVNAGLISVLFHHPDASATAFADLLQPDDNGVVHLYVSPSGDDGSAGHVTEPVQTIKEALRRLDKWLLLRLDNDFVVELANGDYKENVVWNPPVPPRRRVVIRGARDSMTVVKSGTLTSATKYVLTDAGATWGTSNAIVGLVLHVWDPAAKASTEQWMTINEHTNTTLKGVGYFYPVPMAGWKYEILTPAARIIAQVTESYQQPPVSSTMPWTSALSDFSLYAMPLGTGPALWFAWLGVVNTVPTPAACFILRGGTVGFMGVVTEGNVSSLQSQNCSISFGTLFTKSAPDLLFGLHPSDLSTHFGACLGGRATDTFNCIRADGGLLQGSPVCLGSLYLLDGKAVFFGGSVYDGMTIQDPSAEIEISSWFDNQMPFLIKTKTVSRPGIDLKGGTAGLLNRIDWACAGVGIRSRNRGHARLLGPFTGSASAAGLEVAHGGTAHVGTVSTAQIHGTPDVSGDFGVSTASWSAITSGSPFVAVNSGARAWRGD